ncbi:MipA/OmpV family protein [Paraglaciecola aquimarina]|uniref:MipA/OmpV family protein n=1 Tax=Paraglaciecola aquimarina TaxID=1235557 RepID=A0ABU3SUF1_9ALTE|nr:MipA/OmpV family protein [Paraglaciecola aquimarina]MDU0353630.1 MipA/OmpV family protein [Paraglaciecola aquimarina]
MDNLDGAFSWNVTITGDIMSSQSILAGVNQEKFTEFLDISVFIDLYYKGFFIQTNKHRFGDYVNGAELGYELLVNEKYEIDLISKTYLPGFSSDTAELVYEREIPELAGIDEREFLSSQGIRYMGYLPSSVYWIDWAVNLLNSEHRGWVIDGFYSYILQRRNWDINFGGGISLFSSNMNGYYFSVKPEEATQDRPVYDAGAGYRLQLEAFVQRPLSEGWLFNAGVTFSHYSKSISDSPIIDRQNALRAQIGVSYVF